MTASSLTLVSSPLAWQQALARLPEAHVLQSWTWGEFKSRWGWSASPLILELSAEVESPSAAAMVLKRRLPRTPFSILYVPRGPVMDYGNGPLRRVVLAELEQLCRREGAVFIKIDPEVVKSWGTDPARSSADGRRMVEELEARRWRFSSGQIQFRNTVHLAIQRPEEELLAAMKQKTRYNIRLAARRGVTVRLGTPDDFPTIVKMYRETAARDGFSIRPPAYYLDIWNAFFGAGLVQPFLAEYDGEPLAAVLIVRSGDSAVYMYGASTDKHRERMPSYLLQWEAIRWARSQGMERYDFWGAPDEFDPSDPLWGVWRFKAGFQGQVVRHIGAWDYVPRPFWYWLYTVAMPRYLGLLRSRNRSIPGDES